MHSQKLSYLKAEDQLFKSLVALKLSRYRRKYNKDPLSELSEINNDIYNIFSAQLDEFKPTKFEYLDNSCMSGDGLHFRKILSELYLNTVNYIMILKVFSRKIEKLINIKKQEKKFSNIEVLINQMKLLF